MSMSPLRAGQIKAARAMLDWSQEDLAQATGLAINTIRNIEMGAISPRHSTNRVIRQAIENAGLEFTEDEGVKRRNDDVKIYQGADSCEVFFADMIQTIQKTGGEIAIITKSLDLLVRSCGFSMADGQARLVALNRLAPIKCLVAEAQTNHLALPTAQLRITAKQNISPPPCFIYGEHYAVTIVEGALSPRFVRFNGVNIAQAYRSHFFLLWEQSQPLLAAVGQPQRAKA